MFLLLFWNLRLVITFRNFMPLPPPWGCGKLCKKLLPVVTLDKIHQTILYHIVFGKDWKNFKLGDDVFHKLSKKSQVLSHNSLWGKLALSFRFLGFLRKCKNQGRYPTHSLGPSAICFCWSIHLSHLPFPIACHFISVWFYLAITLKSIFTEGWASG